MSRSSAEPPVIYLLTVPMRCLFYGSFLFFYVQCLSSYAVLSVPGGVVVTFWERADILTHFVLCFLVFLSLSHMVFRARYIVLYLIASIPDHCLAYLSTLNALMI